MTNKKGNGVMAGVVGAVVGAAIGATAVVLSDEKNRNKIGKKFEELKKSFVESADSYAKRLQQGEGLEIFMEKEAFKNENRLELENIKNENRYTGLGELV